MWVDTTGGKCYAMDRRPIPMLGVMKDVELKLATYLKVVYIVEINVIDKPHNFGILLSRKWKTIVVKNVQFNLSYATMPTNSEEIKFYREPRVEQIVEKIDQN
jgi:hypothetical protein